MTVYYNKKHKARMTGLFGSDGRDVIVTFDDEGIKTEDKTSSLKKYIINGIVNAADAKLRKLNLNIPYSSIVKYEKGRDQLRKALLITFTDKDNKTKKIAIWAKDEEIRKMTEILKRMGA